ncbi:transporter substrate-binding domain-containing protein [Hoyosella subflava]|uniref:Putative ABC transporter substrate-binding protein n=1 Tax=Hoyosella subflava (strain DSM 45089 / JCM 17490 / NBRC 109087 / DQS3-9A1) TaxID=443218 RepID=F6EIR3_HOYSD|nr:transporter substrate-binding domain-containing protein [Hoyosella subflava]AEF38988.1 Putative ABC transporter substrate-binding protein [Hoyosella subflava DQS3-9A1]
MNRPSRRMASLAGLGLAAVVALSGCALPDPAPGVPQTYPSMPMPSGAEIVPQPDEVEPPPSLECDPTASLRPTEPNPPPGEIRPENPVSEIYERGRLIVGLDAGSNLFSFRDPLTGDLVGFDVDIAREIARDIFGDPDRVEFEILTSAERLTALENSQVDVVVKTMTITCERRERVEFSTSYFQAYQRILTVSGSGINSAEDLADRTVCVVRGTTSLARIQRLQPAATILGVPAWADCLVALQQGQADAISTDDSILAGLNAQDPYLEIVGGFLSSEPYGVGININNQDLVRFVNNTLERIRTDGTWNRLYQGWLSVLGPSPGPPPPRYGD